MDTVEQTQKSMSPMTPKRPFNARPPLAEEHSIVVYGDRSPKEGSPTKQASAADVVSLFSRMCIINTRKMERLHRERAEKAAIAAREKREAEEEEERNRNAETERTRIWVANERTKTYERQLWKMKVVEREERAVKRARDRAIASYNFEKQPIISNPWARWTTPPVGS